MKHLILFLILAAPPQSFTPVGTTQQIQPIGGPIIILPGGSVDALVVAPGIYAEVNHTVGDQAYANCMNTPGQTDLGCQSIKASAIQSDVNARWSTAFAALMNRKGLQSDPTTDQILLASKLHWIPK